MKFMVHGGNFGKGAGFISGGTINLPTKGVHAVRLATVEIVTERTIKRLSGALGWGAAGMLTLGPVGLLAGLMTGGKKHKVTFVASFDDGTSFIATSDQETWNAIKAAQLRYSISGSDKPDAKTELEKPQPPPELTLNRSPVETLKWAFNSADWEAHLLPKRGYERFRVIEASKGRLNSRVLISPDPLTEDYISTVSDQWKDDPGLIKIIIATDVRPSATKASRRLGILVGTPDDMPSLLRLSEN